MNSVPLDLRSNLAKTLPLVLALSVYGGGVAVVDHLGRGFIRLAPTFHTLLGLMLGLLLVFRTNTAYDRWWEGRKLWGQLLNESRNLVVKLATCVTASVDDKRRVADHLIEFARALRDSLRTSVATGSDAAQIAASPPKHACSEIVRRIYEQLERWRQADQLGGFELLFLDRHAAALLDICGGCERIRKTPIAAGYRRFIRQSIAVYLLTLPWGLIDLLEYWTAPVTAVVSYLMIGIEVLAEDVEEPFGVDADDLPLDEFCATIERSVRGVIEG